jgi:MFS family permease
MPPSYWLFIATRRAVFGLPCLFLYLDQRGISAFDIGCCIAARAAGQFLFEVPSGIASDRLGRKWTLVFAAVARAVSWILTGLGSGNTIFFISFAVLGVAFAFDSGTDSAFLFDTLQDRQQTHRYAEYEARSHQVGLIATGIATVGGGLMIPWGYQVPVVATIIPMIVCVAATMTLVEPSATRAADGHDFLTQVKAGLYQVMSIRALFVCTTLAVCGLGACEIYFRFIQQYLHGTVGVSARHFGWLYLVWTLVSVMASRLGQRAGVGDNPLPTMLAIVAVGGVSLIVLGQSQLWLWLLLGSTFVPQVVYGIVPTLFRSELNRELPSPVRATVLSVFGFATACLVAGGGLITGWISERYSIGMGFTLGGALLIAIALWGVGAAQGHSGRKK